MNPTQIKELVHAVALMVHSEYQELSKAVEGDDYYNYKNVVETFRERLIEEIDEVSKANTKVVPWLGEDNKIVAERDTLDIAHYPVK